MEDINAQLKAFQRKSSILGILSIVLFLGTVAAFIIAGAWGFAVAAALVVCVVIFSSVQKKFKSYFVENVIDVCVKDCDFIDELSFDAQNGIPASTVSSTGMIRTGDSIDTTNLVTGVYNGTPFARSDVKITETTHDGDNNHSTSTIFSGRWISFKLNEPISCELQIVSKKFRAAETRGLIKLDGDKIPNRACGEKMFADIFKVFSNAPDTAAGLLAGPLASVVTSVYNSANAPMMFMIIGDTVHIAVFSSSSVFEPSSGGKKDISSFKSAIYNELHSITKTIDSMNV